MLLVGGGWLVILPLLLLLLENQQLEVGVRSPPFLSIGVALFVAGLVLALTAGYYLIVVGLGTPFPLDPTQKLVTQGPYAYVRNPQAIAMVLMVIGEILALQSRFLWGLLPLTLLYLEVLVGPWEERQLARQHGERYTHYRRQVRKWLPQLEAYQAARE